MAMQKYILGFWLVLVCSVFAAGQMPDSRDIRSPKKNMFNSDTVDKAPVYTTPVDFYHLRTPPVDSLDFATHQYDPTRLQDIHYGNLGNLGSANRRQLFQPDKTKGLDYGQHQYDLYKRRFGEFKFYDTERPITELSYSQGLLQLDGLLKAKFAMNFARGIKASIDYQRINQIGNYQFQRAKHTTLGAGIWYDAPGGFYDGLYHYSSNSIVQEDNGGVINYDTIGKLSDPIAIPVNLAGALTTHRERIISAQNHFHLNSRNDSTDRKFQIDLIHTGQYKNGLIKFYDDKVSQSGDYYGDFLVDDRGVRQYIYFSTFDNRADLQFQLRGNNTSELSSQLLRVGLQYRTTNFTQEPLDERLNEVFFNASTRLTFTKQLDLRAQGYVELSGQEGDFNIQGDLRYRIPRLGRLIAKAGVYQRSPNILEQKLYVTQNLIWQNDFNKPLYTHLGLEASFDEIRLTVQGGLQVISNHVYYNNERMPIQVTTAQDIWQFLVRKEISVGKIGLHATAVLQEAPDFLALPAWIGEAQFYYTDRWFKNNMQVRTGVDLRITQSYDGVNYFPLTGQFYLDNTFKIDQYPALDLFFDMQIRETFRLYFKVENFSSWFIDDVYAHVALYPQFSGYFRFGFWMKLFD
jgi:putative beta-barrel porin